MRKNTFPLFLLSLLIGAAGGCSAVRGTLSGSDFGNAVLRSYDKSVSAIGTGVSRSTKKIGDFLSDADDKWLRGILKSKKASPAGRPPASRKKASPPPPSGVDPSAGAAAFRWPVAAGKNTVVTSQFGWRMRGRHRGIDIGGPTGTPVYAVAAGTVIFAANHRNGYGNLVIVHHANGLTSHYAHNDVIKVKENQVVQQGQIIALLGSTGRSTGPHLHFEVRAGDRAVNPCKFLPSNPYLTCRV